MEKELIIDILLDYSPFWKRLYYWRNRESYTNQIVKHIWSKLIKVLVWFRRSWKSYIFRYLIDYLITTLNVDINNILFINLEDDRLFWNRNIETLRLIYETYLEKINPKWKIYLFLDEIQLIDWWESFIRTLYEQNNDLEIFLTWSNSDMLSSEISSSLSWRCMEFKIFPLDFKEYLFFNDVTVKSKLDLSKNKIVVNSLFDKFIKFWWLPEILELKNDEQIRGYLKWIFTKIVIDDIVKRFNIRNIELIELLNKYLITNIWWILSYKSIENTLKSYGYNLSHVTLLDYIDAIKKGFILFDLNKFDFKIKTIFNNFKKYYALDLGIREVEKISFDNDMSKKLENLVFLKLLKEEKKIFYGQEENKKEIDFIVQNLEKFDLYQVILDLNKENEARELWNFVISNKYINGNNFVITLGKTENIEYKWITISKINIIEWLLDL